MLNRGKSSFTAWAKFGGKFFFGRFGIWITIDVADFAKGRRRRAR